MKFNRVFYILAAVLIVSFVLPMQVQAFWVADDIGDDGDIIGEIELIRADTEHTNYPYHELEAGVYGYYDGSVFITVLDFTQQNPYVGPFTQEQIRWIPGPLDL